MKTRKILALAAASVTALVLASVPAYSANSGSTDATFELTTTGTLDITVPASTVNLGSTAIPAVATAFNVPAGTFGTVTVTDGRAAAVLSGNLWVATATGTDFCIDSDAGLAGVQCGGDPNQTVLATAATYTPGTPTVNLGTLAAVVPTAGTLSAGATVAYTALSGNSDVSWDPALSFPITATHVAGVYGGTISHSVS